MSPDETAPDKRLSSPVGDTGPHAYIGTSGWNYTDWAGNLFYPEGLKPTQWLAFYSRHFDSVEVNNTFTAYRTKHLRALALANTGELQVYGQSKSFYHAHEKAGSTREASVVVSAARQQAWEETCGRTFPALARLALPPGPPGGAV